MILLFTSAIASAFAECRLELERLNSEFENSNRLSTVDIDSKKILKLIQGLNCNKAYGHDGISIRMLKLCGLSVIKPLSLLFNNCLRDGVFPNDWKKQKLFQCIKKEISN